MRLACPPFASTSIPRIGAILLGLAGFASATPPMPILRFLMNEGANNSVANTGAVVTTAAAKSPTTPAWSTNVPINGSPYALDFGTGTGPGIYVDMLTPAQMKGLKSFTITGWLNCKNATTGAGGNRIFSNVLPGGTVPGVGKGIDLAFLDDGSLSLGVNQWNDWGGKHSNPGKVTVDPNGCYNNWVFFAVVYNSLITSGQIKFYFGSNLVPAELDMAVDYTAGAVGTHTVSNNTLTLGNINADNRWSGTNQTFRGLIDNIQLFGSTTDQTGALSAADINTVQGATPLTGPGILYEEFTGIPGTTVKDLTTNPAYPNNPTATYVRTLFDGFPSSQSAQRNNYGVKMSGWIQAPTTGDYFFWIASDDNGELRLSTDANPNNKRLIASVPSFTGYKEWTKFASQKSEAIRLFAGQYYYIEALMKEGVGDDGLTVQWQLPGATTPESPIPSSRLTLSPPIDGNLPSSYSMYEPSTSIKKATMGWKKESGKGTMYFESEGSRGMAIQNGTAIFPDRLFFGGKYPNYPLDPNQGDLGFRYSRGVESAVGVLNLETQAGHWAMRAISTAGPEEPNVQFNQIVSLLGPAYTDDNNGVWDGFATWHHVLGTYYQRSLQQSDPNNQYAESAVHNAAGVTVSRNTMTYGFPTKDSSKFGAGEMYLSGIDVYAPTRTRSVLIDQFGFNYEVQNNGTTESRTYIDESGLTAPIVRATAFVSTPKWKVVPDYVFEKDYKLKSLEETERFVREKKHLPDIPSAKEMSTKGLDLADMNLKLLKKMEEMTLHMIAMDKEIKSQRQDNRRLEREVKALRSAGKGN